MLEISPVLSGKYDRADYVPPATNINAAAPDDATQDTDASSSVDSRRYSQFDRTASQVGDATMSFGDFLDMVNPLQHIPVVSSIYREITGDKINPVSRVAGDILYGAPLGILPAITGAIGGVADSVMEAKTGKDMTGTVYAALFGDDAADGKAPVMLAANDANSTAQASVAAIAQAPVDAATNVPAQTPAQAAPQVQPPAAPQTAPMTLASLTAASSVPPSNSLQAKSYPLPRNNQPFGGALAHLPDYHDENLKMAVSGATGLRVGNTVYPNRMFNGMRSLPPAAPAIQAGSTNAATVPAATAAVTPAMSTQTATTAVVTPAVSNAAVISALSGTKAGTTTTASATPQSALPSALPYTPTPANALAAGTVIPPGLQDDAAILKAIGLYKNVAASGGYQAAN